MRRALAALTCAAAALASAGAAAGAVQLRGVDASEYPTIRMSAVTSKPSGRAPVLLEDGRAASGLVAENLGSAKSVVLAIDRSQSMAGSAFAHARAAAASFVARKPQADRVAVVGFGSRALQVTPFSATTPDVATAIRELRVDDERGTSLYDAVMLSTRLLSRETLPGRVIVVLTDGTDEGSAHELGDAAAAARDAGAPVYTVAIESEQFSPQPLQRMAERTGGSYRGARSSSQLRAIYADVARELRRTWRLEYVTAARPGDELQLTVAAAGARARAELPIPSRGGENAAARPALPNEAFENPFSTTILAGVVGLLFLLAVTFATTSVRGERLRRRLAPHLAENLARTKHKQERERLAVAAGLFRATESAFSHWRQWQSLQRLLERADLPLRTVEFVYLMAASAVLFGLVAAVAARSSLVILAAFAAGAAVPFAFVWFKGVQRLNAFENQLPDLLITLAASLKAGHSFKQGLQGVVDEGRPPASKELQRVLTEARLGRPMDEALNDMAARVGSKNFDFVITAVSIQRQVGGSLAGLIDMVADTVRQRQQFARKIKGLTAMGRASAYVLMGLPFFIGFVITIMNPRYMHPLYHTSTGHKLIFGGIAMMLFGAAVLRKIVSFKG